MKKHKHVTAGQKRWVVTNQFVTPVVDWQEEVLRMLLEATTNGVTQSELINRVYGLGIRAQGIKDFLETYRAQNAVQRFTIGNLIVWRATTKLKDVI